MKLKVFYEYSCWDQVMWVLWWRKRHKVSPFKYFGSEYVSDVIFDLFCLFTRQILIFWHWDFALDVKIKRKLSTRWKASRSGWKILESQLDKVDHISELVLQLATFNFITASQISWKRDGKKISLIGVILIVDKPHLFPSGFCSQSFQVDKLNNWR